MFDTVKVGKIIAQKRKEHNMTQLALADRLGVSFQAVSNWERGNSMPDISKLPELAELFECSIEELLGGGAPAAKVEQIAKEGADDLSLGDLAEVASVLTPDLLDEAVQKASGRHTAPNGGSPCRIRIEDGVVKSVEYLNDDEADDDDDEREESGWSADGGTFCHVHIENGKVRSAEYSGEDGACGDGDDKSDEDKTEAGHGGGADDERERRTRIGELTALAPFLSEERLAQLAEECLQDGYTVRELVPLAPFLGGEMLDRLAERAVAGDGKDLVSLAPFLSQETLGKLVAKNEICGKMLVYLAPFLSGETLRDAALDALGRGEKIDKGLYPFLSEEIFSEILKTVGRKGN